MPRRASAGLEWLFSGGLVDKDPDLAEMANRPMGQRRSFSVPFARYRQVHGGSWHVFWLENQVSQRVPRSCSSLDRRAGRHKRAAGSSDDGVARHLHHPRPWGKDGLASRVPGSANRAGRMPPLPLSGIHWPAPGSRSPLLLPRSGGKQYRGGA